MPYFKRYNYYVSQITIILQIAYEIKVSNMHRRVEILLRINAGAMSLHRVLTVGLDKSSVKDFHAFDNFHSLDA